MYTRKWLWMSSHIYTNKFSVKSSFHENLCMQAYLFFLSSRRVVVTSQNKMKKKFNQKTHYTTMYVTHSQKIWWQITKNCLKNFVIILIIVVIFKTKKLQNGFRKKKEIFKILKKTNNNKSLPIIITTTTALICRVKTSRIESSRIESSRNLPTSASDHHNIWMLKSQCPKIPP